MGWFLLDFKITSVNDMKKRYICFPLSNDSFDFFFANYSETILFTNILANGMIRRLVGKATTKPVIHPLTNL